MNFKNFPFLLFFCFLAFQSSHAQQLTTNENGEKIIVYPDGSWKYAGVEDIRTYYENKTWNPPTDKKKSELARAILIAEYGAAKEANAIRNEEDAKYDRMLLEDELKEAKASDDINKEDLNEIKERLKTAKAAEKEAKSNRKKANKIAQKTAALITMDPERRSRHMKKYEELLINEIPDRSTKEETGMFPGEFTESSNKREHNKSATVERSDNKVFAKYNAKEDVFFNPPIPECELSFDGVDEFSGKTRKDVAEQLFFDYTNEELRSIFKDREYLTCHGYLSSLSGGVLFLTLNITIASKTAQREYGILEKGSYINIKLLDGENIKLVNTKTSMGTPNPLEGSVSYKAQYLIGPGDEKTLKKSEIDKVRIIWSSGYEDYEIYELDFFIDQFNCLNSKK